MTGYATAIPTLALLTVGSRLWYAVFALVTAVLQFVLILPVQGIFSRVTVSIILFHAFMLYLDFVRELSERRIWQLNSSLKHAYRLQQKAQIAESHANNSKKRYVSYLFHEVRVPLNTASLAWAALKGTDAVRQAETGPNAIEVHALDGSLSMISSVLNDVLEFQRLDHGRFDVQFIAFPLHRAIESLLGSVRVATQAKNLGLVVDLDPGIDRLGQDGGPLWAVGDEIRLRQIISNLYEMLFRPR